MASRKSATTELDSTPDAARETCGRRKFIKQEMRRLEAASAGAWASLARSGNPNHKGLPNWRAYTPKERAVMIFDTQSRIEKDPTRDVREIMEKRGITTGPLP